MHAITIYSHLCIHPVVVIITTTNELSISYIRAKYVSLSINMYPYAPMKGAYQLISRVSIFVLRGDSQRNSPVCHCIRQYSLGARVAGTVNILLHSSGEESKFSLLKLTAYIPFSCKPLNQLTRRC